uniref:Uncharacterized protein n=1 Tax=Oryza meridionalis TaxID=40149 RepID=A0A0E0EME2_9ORYZ
MAVMISAVKAAAAAGETPDAALGGGGDVGASVGDWEIDPGAGAGGERTGGSAVGAEAWGDGVAAALGAGTGAGAEAGGGVVTGGWAAGGDTGATAGGRVGGVATGGCALGAGVGEALGPCATAAAAKSAAMATTTRWRRAMGWRRRELGFGFLRLVGFALQLPSGGGGEAGDG